MLCEVDLLLNSFLGVHTYVIVVWVTVCCVAELTNDFTGPNVRFQNQIWPGELDVSFTERRHFKFTMEQGIDDRCYDHVNRIVLGKFNNFRQVRYMFFVQKN